MALSLPFFNSQQKPSNSTGNKEESSRLRKMIGIQHPLVCEIRPLLCPSMLSASEVTS
jgi:hypothetical protein